MFLAGVAAWFVARFWAFGHYSPISIAFVTAWALTLAVLVVRGDDSYRWLVVAISAGQAYRSFAVFFYLKSKGIPCGAYLLPGTIFTLCSVALFTTLLANSLRNRRALQ